MSEMAGGESELQKKTSPLVVKAPSYQELYDLTTSLQARLTAALEGQQNAVPNNSPVTNSSATQNAPICADFRLLPDLNRSVPIFTGHETSIAAEDWLGSVDALATINNWPEQYRLQFVKSNLTTAARGWFLTESFRDWSEFRLKFRATFVRTLRMSDRWNLMNERRQDAEEHIADYFYDKLQLCQALNLSFTEVREQIIAGIRSQGLATYAMSRTHTASSELLADLREWERLNEMRWRQFPMPPKTATVAKPIKAGVQQINHYRRGTDKSTASSETHPSATDVVAGPRGTSSMVRCYNCGGTGHIARDCPKPRKPCSGCKSTSHSRGQCTVAPRSSTTTAETMCAEFVQAVPSTNAFIKTVYFNEHRTTCLIDSGSSHVLVRPGLADRVGVTVRQATRPVYTVGDVHQPSVVTLGEATASIMIDGAYAEDHPVCVVSDDSIPVDVLVGRTWLDLPHINYYKRGNDFVIEAISAICPSVTTENVESECSDIHTALVDVEKPVPSPLVEQDVKIDSNVPPDERMKLLTLLNEYRHVFAKSLAKLGCTDVLHMDIVETPGSEPVRQRPYRTSPSDR